MMDIETQQIVERLLKAMPAATFELETLTRLANIVASRDIPTAAIECKHRPRLLINPDFVKTYCERDEHLFLLVMHELWHVLLAHTSLYARVTPAQNIAFDAIINATLIRRFIDPAFMGFFDRINPPDTFPHLLLRPPQGWPHNPIYPTDIGSIGTERILRQLYPPHGSLFPLAMPFYGDILDLIRQYQRDKGIDQFPVLLGYHDENADMIYRNTFLKETMGRVTKKWPFAPGRGGGGFTGIADDWAIDTAGHSYELRRVFASLLRQYIGGKSNVSSRQIKPLQVTETYGVLPNGRDRLMPAKRALESSNLLWAQDEMIQTRVNTKTEKTFVYLDVSGSMSDVLPYLLGLVRLYVANGQIEVYQFSTTVDYLPLNALNKSVVHSTGGTNIQCVMKHMEANLSRMTRLLFLTDGYTGRPTSTQVDMIKSRHIPVCVVLPYESPYEDDLRDIAHKIVVLPSVS